MKIKYNKSELKLIENFLIDFDLGIENTPFEDEVYIIPKKTLDDLKNDRPAKKT